MGRYQAYLNYKDSGVDWLGMIPSHWSLTRVRESAQVINGFPFDSTKFDPANGIPLVRIRDINSQTSEVRFNGDVPKEALIYNGDILIGMDGDFNVASWTGGEAALNQRVACVRAEDKVKTRFLYYLLPFNMKVVNDLTYFTTVKHLSSFDILKTKYALPPNSELAVIANFLDHETAKIDTLIEHQQQLIQLLKEKRQAVISHAVTKGLNPDAVMKDSGVEWLGEVPEHWVICRLKHIKSLSQNAFVDGPFGSNLKSEHFIDNGDVYVIESNFATTGEIDTSSLKTISNAHFETIKRSEATAGDIIIAKIGARFGMSSILPSLDKKSVVSGNSLKLTLNANVVSRMYAHKLLTVLKELGAMDDGVNGSAQPALSLGELNNLLFLVPPIQEQVEIEKFIQLNQDKFDVLLEKANVQVRLLQERRTALISAAVTGKIDVRNWQAPNN